jgi:hypothetical protein
MSGTGFPSGSGLDDPAAWAVPVQPGVPDTRQVHPQGDAAMPVALWANHANIISAGIARGRGGPYDQHTCAEVQTDYHRVPLVRQSDAQATIAARDAEIDRLRDDPKCIELALCESQSLVLREGVPYRFVRVDGCDKCAAMSAASLEAYGRPPHQPAPEAAQLAAPPHAQEWLSDLLFSAAHCGSSAYHTMRVREMLGPEHKELAESVIARANNQQAQYEAALLAQPADTAGCTACATCGQPWPEPADTEAQVAEVVRLVTALQYVAADWQIERAGVHQLADAREAVASAIRRLVGGK